ncbi:hypothetical protein [Bacteroides xylanisolvens]|nr:hypothetical protein [Bacteroides xylanisolvens]MDE5407400.1 hypothetical protein [Bacteroides xylanisolvens]
MQQRKGIAKILHCIAKILQILQDCRKFSTIRRNFDLCIDGNNSI